MKFFIVREYVFISKLILRILYKKWSFQQGEPPVYYDIQAVLLLMWISKLFIHCPIRKDIIYRMSIYFCEYQNSLPSLPKAKYHNGTPVYVFDPWPMALRTNWIVRYQVLATRPTNHARASHISKFESADRCQRPAAGDATLERSQGCAIINSTPRRQGRAARPWYGRRQLFTRVIWWV